MPSSDQLDLSDASAMAERVGHRIHAMEAAEAGHHRRPLHLTDRLFDESQTAGQRTYLHCNQAINTAWENYRAVFSLLGGAGGATPWAPYSLIRPAFESSFFALWALEPADGKKRRLRGLTLAAIDNKEHGNWVREIVKIAELEARQREAMLSSISRARAVYKSEASALGVRYETVLQRPNIIDQLPKLEHIKASENIVEHTMVAAWRQLSGYQHGHTYAIVSSADRKIEARIPGGFQARITINDDHFSLTMQVAALLILWAIDTYVTRTTRSTP